MIFNQTMKYLVLIFILFFPYIGNSEDSSVTVLMYHRFNESKHPATNISLEVFEQQIEYLVNNNFNVLPLTQLVMFLKNNKKIPNKSVFITIDDAYKSFYKYGFPILKKFKLPFSIFVSSDFISSNDNSDFMNWAMLREISKNQGLILNHTKNHESLLNIQLHDLSKNITENQRIIERKLGTHPKIFSYPYGESNIEIEEVIKNLNYQIAFSQHSSPISKNDNLFRLPRFALNEEFGDLERFKQILELKPLTIENLSFEDTIFNTDNLQLSFESKIPSKDINCVVNNLASLKKESIGYVSHLNIKNLKLATRYRINCTHTNKKGDIFWFGKMVKRIN